MTMSFRGKVWTALAIGVVVFWTAVAVVVF